MKATLRITVPVLHISLDLGEVSTERGRRVVSSPKETLFDQLRLKLSSALSVTPAASAREEARAAAVLCVRWGSYYSVLADLGRPLWRVPAGCSRIADSEMARINIEASSALAELLRLRKSDPPAYAQVVRASAKLPLQASPPKPGTSRYLTLVFSKVREVLPALPVRPDIDDRIAYDPCRALANSMINMCWRNGPIEDVHAGPEAPTPLPLAKRRVSGAADRKLMTNLLQHLTDAFEAFGPALAEDNGYLRAAQTLSYVPLAFPSGWSVTERSRTVELAGPET